MTHSDMIIGNGHTAVTTATVRVPLVTGLAGGTKVQSVTIQALSANSGLIYVGDSSVAAANGHQLLASQGLIFVVPPDLYAQGARIDLATIWLDAAVNGEGVCYTYTKV